jgi:F-type H+-transporting ATPase subunit gamma
MSGLTDRVDVLAATPSGGAFRRLASRTVLPLEGDIGIFLTRDWIVEPSRAAILGQLAQECYRSSLVLAAVGSETAEQMARLTAMTAATRNADDMLADLKLASNKIRQAAITSELTEIVAGTA